MGQIKKESLTSIIGLFVAQTIIAGSLYILCNFLSLFTHYVFGGIFTFSLYALIWWFIWWIQYGENGIPYFFVKQISATLPLLILTVLYITSHPEPNYTLMIPLLPQDIHFDFSMVVTGTLLFPLYSFALQRYVLPRTRTWIRFTSASFGVTIVGTVIFILCYNALPLGW